MELNLKIAEKEEEIEFLFKVRTHPDVCKMLIGNPPNSLQQHKEYINKVQNISRHVLIAYNENNEMIGYSQIYDIRENQLEVGFVIYPDYQGKGYGTLIVQKTIEKAKELYPTKKIILYVKDTNTKGIHIYHKCGFGKDILQDNMLYMELL